MDYDFDKLAANFSRRFLKVGDVLFREGDTNGDGYIIETGELELIRNEGDTKIRTAVLGEGEVLGVWKILFANNERYFTAKATVKTAVIVIPEAHLQAMLDQADPFLLHCFRKWLDVSRQYMKGSSSK